MILRPALAETWTPSEDGLTWTLTLRQGVTFNHGKDFNADDVVFTINRLIDPNTASAFPGAAPYVTGVEKLDDFTVNIHTNRVAADFIYSLFLYVAAVLPADWPGDFVANPWGTGPFTMTEFNAGEHVRFQRRTDYWGMGTDNQSLPYLDGVDFINFGDDLSALTALREGTIQLGLGVPSLRDQYSAIPGLNYVTVQTGSHEDAIMHFNEEPWTDWKIREAVKLSFDRQAFVETNFLGAALPANDQPIAPGIYPLAPASVTARVQDYERARQLMAEGGYPNGFDVTLLYPASEDSESFATFMASQLRPIGINATLQPDPNYYDRWLDDWGPFYLGVDKWTQKNTASEILNLAYRSTGIWNESHWVNRDFDTLLDQFDAELDQDTRQQQLQQLMDMISADGAVLIPSWHQDALVVNSRFHYQLHPQLYVWLADAWLEQS
ncbi:MAG: hypothetical protein IPK17_35605 [Chloroflexi bacterium]|uniref:ABC transporter substrate-binding protein n=1 Tax=Candidatus Flexifilum breve TaxID=3140694 RepID=UPI0031376591|nr:hypothetical protein [Chloroflexota bacterium]